MPHIVEENLDALVIYPAANGVGWHADVVLKATPPGIADILGTPVQSPARTRRDAEERGRDLLVSLLWQSERNKVNPAPKAPPAFSLYGRSIHLHAELYDAALAEYPQFADGYSTPQRAVTRIAQTLAELCPLGFDHDEFRLWSIDKKASLLTVLHLAALSGVIRYPLMVEPDSLDDIKPVKDYFDG